MKSKELRNTDSFLRNTFYGIGKNDMPVIYKHEVDVNTISLKGFHNTKAKDIGNAEKTIHFFMDDCKFERVWRYPEHYITRLKQYKYVLSPDFSLYTNMPIAMQIYNTFRRRWCSAYWQTNGLTVIPAVTWGDERSFDFCFDGIEKNSTVAVSTLGSKKTKEAFLKGFVQMCQRITPEKVLCYCEPFVEMYEVADIVAYPYEGLAACNASKHADHEGVA